METTTEAAPAELLIATADEVERPLVEARPEADPTDSEPIKRVPMTDETPAEAPEDAATDSAKPLAEAMPADEPTVSSALSDAPPSPRGAEANGENPSIYSILS